jgi:hypothetical protein
MRMQAGVRQDELAARAGISKSHLSASSAEYAATRGRATTHIITPFN